MNIRNIKISKQAALLLVIIFDSSISIAKMISDILVFEGVVVVSGAAGIVLFQAFLWIILVLAVLKLVHKILDKCFEHKKNNYLSFGNSLKTLSFLDICSLAVSSLSLVNNTSVVAYGSSIAGISVAIIILLFVLFNVLLISKFKDGSVRVKSLITLVLVILNSLFVINLLLLFGVVAAPSLLLVAPISFSLLLFSITFLFRVVSLKSLENKEAPAAQVAQPQEVKEAPVVEAVQLAPVVKAAPAAQVAQPQEVKEAPVVEAVQLAPVVKAAQLAPVVKAVTESQVVQVQEVKEVKEAQKDQSPEDKKHSPHS